MFREIFRARAFRTTFVQANHSRSEQRVLRGLHYHRKQADLWYIVAGEAMAACVDLRVRQDPPPVWTTVLSSEEPVALYIPPGVAHGFLARTRVDLVYWVSREYDETDEYGLAWDEPSLGLDWGLSDPIVSERDARNQRLDWSTIEEF